jgi:hypothetical protein
MKPSLLNTGGAGIDRFGHCVDLLFAQWTAREPQTQSELEILRRPQNLRCGTAAVGTAGFRHAAE